jgi:hypothetical protein
MPIFQFLCPVCKQVTSHFIQRVFNDANGNNIQGVRCATCEVEWDVPTGERIGDFEANLRKRRPPIIPS